MLHSIRQYPCADTDVTLDQQQQDIVAAFSDLGDIFAQYTYVVELSTELPVMDERRKEDSVLVDKCQSLVWINASVDENGCVSLEAESDTLIVRGVLMLLLSLLNGRSVEEIRDARVSFLEDTDLRDAFSDDRLSGFASICKTIKSLCEE